MFDQIVLGGFYALPRVTLKKIRGDHRCSFRRFNAILPVPSLPFDQSSDRITRRTTKNHRHHHHHHHQQQQQQQLIMKISTATTLMMMMMTTTMIKEHGLLFIVLEADIALHSS